MESILDRLNATPDKTDSPERKAILEQFGEEYYADAEFLNLLKQGLIEALSSTGAGGAQNNKIKFQTYLSFAENTSSPKEVAVAQIMNSFSVVTFTDTDVPFVIIVSMAAAPPIKHIYAFKNGKGTYGGSATQVTGQMLQYVNTIGANTTDLQGAANTFTINLGEILTDDYVSVLNESEYDLRNSTLVYILIYTYGGTSFSKHFVGATYGKYGAANSLQFTETDWEDNGVGEIPAPALPTLKQITTASGGLTNTALVVESLQHGITQGKTIYASGSITRYDSLNNRLLLKWPELQVSGVELSIPAKSANDTFAMASDLNALYNQIIDGAPTEYNTLNKIAVKLSAVSNLIGSSAADADNIVNTVAEILSVFQNYPEGLNLLTALASKVNTGDIVNNLSQAASGKPLDAAQGKVLKDLIDANTTAISGKLNAGANAGLTGTNTRVGLILPDGTVTFNANLYYDSSTHTLYHGTSTNPGKLEIGGTVSRLKVLTNITTGNAFVEFNANQQSAYAFKDTDAKTYMVFRSIQGNKCIAFPVPLILDHEIFFPVIPVQAALTSAGAGTRVYGKDSLGNIVTVPFTADGQTAFFEITFMLKNSTASQVIAGKFKAVAKRTSAGGGTITVVQQTTEFVSNNSTYSGSQVGIEAVSNTAVRFYFTPDAADITEYKGAFSKIEYTFNG